MRRVLGHLRWSLLGLLVLLITIVLYFVASNYYGSRRDERARKMVHDYLFVSNINLARKVSEVLSNKNVFLNFLYQDSVENGYLGRNYFDFDFGVINYIGETVLVHPRLGVVSGYMEKVAEDGTSSVQLAKDGKVLPVVISRSASIATLKSRQYVYGSDKNGFVSLIEGGSIGLFTLYFGDKNYVLDIQLR